MIGPEKLLAPLAYALPAAGADQLEISADVTHQGITRYAGSRIHQTTELHETRVYVRAVVGKSVGGASGDSLARPDLQSLVEQAIATARIQQPDPTFVSLPAPQPLQPVRGFDSATAAMGPEERAAAIHTITQLAAERGWTASGTYLTEGRELAVVNSLGISSYTPSSAAFLRALPDSGRGTGYADALSFRAADLDPIDVVTRALAKCARNHDQREIEPGEYATIFDDLCVAEMLTALATRGFSGEAYEDGNSFLSGRLGERVTGERVTIWDDATDPRSLAVAADWEGIPKRRLPLIERGIARDVAYDSYTAHRAGKQSNGNADNPERTYYGPTPTNLFMAGGETTTDQMIRATQRGLLVTRFHYTHVPDPQRVVLTGTTRDGTFLIENGEIVAAVRNLRLTHAIPDLFAGIELLGPPRLCQDWWSSNGMGRVVSVCPPIKVNRALFSSGTLF
jgi:PmbA protein